MLSGFVDIDLLLKFMILECLMDNSFEELANSIQPLAVTEPTSPHVAMEWFPHGGGGIAIEADHFSGS